MLMNERLVNILASDKVEDFIEEHLFEDTHLLALTEIELDKDAKLFALDQIDLLQRIKKKCPEFYKERCFLTKKGAEQCSSEAMANYKAQLFAPFSSVLDLSFGTGIDAFAFATEAKNVKSIEIEDQRFELGKANISKRNFENISLLKGDGILYLKESGKRYDIIYSDPDRRTEADSRMKGWMELNPSVQETIRYSMGKCDKLILKLSPLLELKDFLQLNPLCNELHFISLNHEMKEVLAVFNKMPNKVEVNVHEIGKNGGQFCFDQEDIQHKKSNSSEADFIYQLWPGFSASRTLGKVSDQLGLNLLGNSETLCCSKSYIKVPGKAYKVISSCGYKELKTTLDKFDITEAAIHSRSVRLKPEVLRKRLKLKESDRYEIFLVKDTADKSKGYITERIK